MRLYCMRADENSAGVFKPAPVFKYHYTAYFLAEQPKWKYSMTTTTNKDLHPVPSMAPQPQVLYLGSEGATGPVSGDGEEPDSVLSGPRSASVDMSRGCAKGMKEIKSEKNRLMDLPAMNRKI